MARILVNKIPEHPKECKFSHEINGMWYCKANFDNLCEILYDKKECEYLISTLNLKEVNNDL